LSLDQSSRELRLGKPSVKFARVVEDNYFRHRTLATQNFGIQICLDFWFLYHRSSNP